MPVYSATTGLVSDPSPSTVTVTVKVNWSNVGLHTLSSGYGGISNSKVVTGSASMRKEAN